MRPNTEAIGGTKSTKHIKAVETRLARFRYLLVNSPVLNSDLWERILYACRICAKASTRKAMVRPPSMAPVTWLPTRNPISDRIANMTPCKTTWIPSPLAKIPSFLGFGWRSITLGSMASIPRAIAGRESVTRLIHSSCMDSKGAWFQSSMAIKVTSTSPILVPRRNATAFLILS